MGKPTHSRLKDLVRGSLLEEVVRGSGSIDLQIVAADAEAQKPEAIVKMPEPIEWPGLFWAAGLVAVATAVAANFRGVAAPEDLVMVYLLVIMRLATRLGLPASVLAYDFFFVPPYYKTQTLLRLDAVPIPALALPSIPPKDLPPAPSLPADRAPPLSSRDGVPVPVERAPLEPERTTVALQVVLGHAAHGPVRSSSQGATVSSGQRG